MDWTMGSPWTQSVVGGHGPGVSVFGLPLELACLRLTFINAKGNSINNNY